MNGAAATKWSAASASTVSATEAKSSSTYCGQVEMHSVGLLPSPLG